MKLKQSQDSQVSGEKSQSEWLSLRQPDFGDLLAIVRIARKREFRIKFETLHAGNRYGIAEMKLKQPQNSQVSGDSEWLCLRRPDFGDLLAIVRIARKREFRIKFEILHAGNRVS